MSEQLVLNLSNDKDRAKVARVLTLIHMRAGRANAISPKAVEEQTGVRYRDVQAIVKFLVEERGYAIGTATSEPFGYYVIRSEEELDQNYRHFVRRGVSNLKHARAFRKQSIVGPIVGQLEIEMGEK
jgi:hypothetical protein